MSTGKQESGTTGDANLEGDFRNEGAFACYFTYSSQPPLEVISVVADPQKGSITYQGRWWIWD